MNIQKLTKSSFKDFLAAVPLNVMKLKTLIIARSGGFIMNYDLNTIDEVQVFYYNAYHKKFKLEIGEQELQVMFWSYIGEAVIFHLGGRWELAPKSDEAEGTPIIVEWGGKTDRPRISPYIWEKRLIENRLRESISVLIKGLKN